MKNIVNKNIYFLLIAFIFFVIGCGEKRNTKQIIAEYSKWGNKIDSIVGSKTSNRVVGGSFEHSIFDSVMSYVDSANYYLEMLKDSTNLYVENKEGLLNNIGIYCFRIGLYEEANKYMDSLIAITQDNKRLAKAWSNKGNNFGMLHQYVPAYDCQKKSYYYDSSNTITIYNLILAMIATNSDVDKIPHLLQRGYALDSANVVAYAKKGKKHSSIKYLFDLATAEYYVYITKDVNGAMAIWNKYVDENIKSGNNELAATILKNAAESLAKLPEHYNDALKTYERILDIYPNDTDTKNSINAIKRLIEQEKSKKHS
jgi:tetratricopeptide (TPR) repeat protein